MRDLVTTDNTNALLAVVIRPRIFVEIVTNTTTLRMVAASQDIVWGGYTWQGALIKDFGSISESTELGADGFWLDLAGEIASLTAAALTEFKQNRPIRLYLGLLNSDDNLIGPGILLFDGLLDTVEIMRGVQESTIRISAENKLINFERQKEFRYNHETQQIFFPGDRGFEYVAQLEDWAGYWGKPQRNKKKKKKNG